MKEEIEVVYKLIHFKLLEGYEVLGEYDTEEDAEAAAAELLIRMPEAVHAIARVPRRDPGRKSRGGDAQ